MFDRRLIQYFDWGLLVLALVLSLIGVLAVYSAVVAGISTPKALYIKQIMWFCFGLLIMVMSFLFNYKILYRWAPFLYLIGIFLLLGVLIFGKKAGGSSRWLIIGPLTLQPSELLKLFIIISLSRYYSQHVNFKGLSLQELIYPVILVFIPFILIIKQPDLGTAMLIGFIAISMTIFIKLEKRAIIYMMTAFVIMTPVVPLAWSHMKDYQKERILTFINPDHDPLGSGYHIIQSKIAIGSGMISGKGFLKGTQNVLSFLPEQHTDFIFSVLAEEWGFNGAVVLILLFLLLMIWGLDIAYRCREPFGTILCVGIISMIAWQVLINIGMVMGLLPVVGVPLPFISYGGSSLITMMVCIGLLLNVSMRRFMFE